MRKPKENDQYVKAVEYSHTLEKLLIMEREKSDALRNKLEAAECERDELRKTLQATQGGETEAIKNVMLMQEEISRLDKESQSLSDQLGACDRQRLDWLKRALTAEAEIARRDAAAGEPIAWRCRATNMFGDLIDAWKLSETKNQTGTCQPLYTAAQPAVLPPPLDNWHRSASGVMQKLQFNGDELSFTAGANWMREKCLELCAQQQKVVELYKRKSMEVISGQRYSYVLLEDLLPELDAAGVKWEVKK